MTLPFGGTRQLRRNAEPSAPFPFDGTAEPPADAGTGRTGGQLPITRTTGGRGRGNNAWHAAASADGRAKMHEWGRES